MFTTCNVYLDFFPNNKSMDVFQVHGSIFMTQALCLSQIKLAYSVSFEKSIH